MIYWILIGMAVILFPIEKKKVICGIGNSNHKINGTKIWFVIITIALVLISALRSDVVGQDTSMYHTLFNYAKESNNFWGWYSSWKGGGTEIGYSLLEYCISRFANFQFFLLPIALITIIPVMFLIYKYSSNHLFSIFLFIAFGYYAFFMNGIRQSIAMGLCCIAYVFAREKKLIPYLIIITIAVLFHLSAVIFIPVYWLSRLKITKYTPVIYVGLLITSFGLKNIIFKLLNMFSRFQYTGSSDAGGERMYMFMMFTIFILWFFRKQLLKEDVNGDNTTLLYMTAIAGLLWPIASANSAVFRLYYYYHMFFIISIPELVYKIKNKSTKLAISFVFVLVGVYFLYQYVICSDLHYSPYFFFWG